MDITVAASALYTISTEFDNFRQCNWIVLAYSSAYVGQSSIHLTRNQLPIWHGLLGFATVFTRVSEVFNRKTAVIISFIIFIAFSLACGWAKTLTQLIIFRTLQGAGGSGLYTLSMVILPEICPLKFIPAMSALVGFVVAVAGVSGPIFGGLLATRSSWRWCFWMKWVLNRYLFWNCWSLQKLQWTNWYCASDLTPHRMA